MPVRTGRADQNASVTVDHDRCTACGLCAKVCLEGPLYTKDKKLHVDQSRGFGCFGCGHCVAICPQNCIAVEGRDLHGSDGVPLPPREARASHDQLHALLLARRSIRHFQSRDVEPEVIDRIIQTATTAPLGITPSDVEVLVFKGAGRVQEISRDILAAMGPMERFFSGPLMFLLRPLLGRELGETIRTFLLPAIKAFRKTASEGRDALTHNAPLGMLFYSSPYAGPNPADPLIAATYAVIAAESLGLGSCMLGFPAPVLKRNKKLLAKYGIPPRAPLSIMVVFGYPAVEYRRAIQRRFAGVRYW